MSTPQSAQVKRKNPDKATVAALKKQRITNKQIADGVARQKRIDDRAHEAKLLVVSRIQLAAITATNAHAVVLEHVKFSSVVVDKWFKEHAPGFGSYMDFEHACTGLGHLAESVSTIQVVRNVYSSIWGSTYESILKTATELGLYMSSLAECSAARGRLNRMLPEAREVSITFKQWQQDAAFLDMCKELDASPKAHECVPLHSGCAICEDRPVDDDMRCEWTECIDKWSLDILQQFEKNLVAAVDSMKRVNQAMMDSGYFRE